ncbi:MAG TPA: MgtC/SapB family protein [Chthoniobacteraceae bacterium]|nr:MgtC/SapB family protein [Chthoniobacteraceae bacterium]
MHWLYESWYALIPSPWVQILLAPMAAICGGVVGMEREVHEKPAGLRTMSLVCLGSCIFTIAGFSFTTTTGDSGRVAAQIVTGIGFLGGGMLLRGPGGITGVTTAATVWVVAAMGIVVGSGHGIGGIALAGLIVAVLRAVGVWEQTRFGGADELVLSIVFNPDRGKGTVKVTHALEEFGLLRKKVIESEDGTGMLRWTIRCHLSERKRHGLLLNLAQLTEVHAIDQAGA